MAFYQGTREKEQSTLSAMEGQARQNLAKARGAKMAGGELMAPQGGANTGSLLMGSGSQRSTRNREAYGHFRSWVYVCVDAIARRLAGQDLMAGEIEGAEANPENDRARRLNHKSKKLVYPPERGLAVPKSTLKYVGQNQQLSVFESHPALDLLARPNAVQRKFEFLYMSAANLLLTGECYWVGMGGSEAEGEDGEVWAVPTAWMTPIHDGNLFSSYKLQVSGQAVAKDIPADMVARTYFADPADLKSAYSPLRAILQAIRVDDYIQESQEQMFERGINPNLIVTVGRVRGEDGTLTDRRPVLSGPNRRQIIRAIREIWNQTVSTGDPAILDGLIESVHKLHNTPQEMDWPGSGEIVKKRVMQGFKVNPIVVGEVTAGNRAQAIEAEKNFCSNAVNPFEFVTTLYGRPAYWERDPTPLLAPFFIVFFGLCVSDGGYGVTLAAVSFFLMKKMQPGGGRQLMKLLMMGGISTAVVGAVTGGWFGIDQSIMPEWLKSAIVMNPLEEPMKMLNVVFILGIVQVMAGLIIKMVADIQEGRWLDGILDQLLWVFFLALLVPLGYSFILGGSVPADVAAFCGKGAMAAGALVVLTGARKNRNPVMKVLGGVLKLYDIVGYFGDVLSYARLLALGLATGAIAMAINGVAEMASGIPIVGPVAAVVVLIGGHLFNLAVNCLGGFVHSARLQYLEFFSKFFTGGGRAFQPFSVEKRYSITKKE